MVTKLRNTYHNASQWAHHHTAVLVFWLTMIAATFGWQFGSYVTYAAESSPQHERCDAQELWGFLQIPLEECHILADFYVATDGDNWYSTQNNNARRFQWSGWVSICRWGWYGVNNCSNDPITGRQRIQNIGFNRTQEWNNLNGYIPSSLYSLPMLDTIHITRNQNLVVNIDDITQSPYAANFISVNVHNSSIYGNVNNFVNTPNLQYLDISCYRESNFDNCNVTGDTSFVASLPNLYGLRIGWHTDVTFDLSDLENSPQIQQIHALNNYIIWDLSSLTWATGMQSLDLGCRDILEGQCDVTGNLNFVQNMINIEYLSLDDLVNIEWTLDVLYDKVQLTQIDLTNNKISGTIGVWIGNLVNLQHLDLNRNQLEWTLPEEMYNLSRLNELEIQENQLTWPLLYFWSFPLLERLSLWSNAMDYTNVWDMILPQEWLCIHAAWPSPCIWGQSRLKKLSIHDANIWWTIPDIWDKFPHLEDLQLQFSKLTWPLPASFASLTNLRELELRFNNLDGDIPSYLTALSLEDIAIESNCFNTDITDPDLLALLDEQGSTRTNQFNCRANLQITAESTSWSIAPGQCEPYTINYINLGPQKAINVIIGQSFGDNLSASGSVPPYEEGLVGRVYGKTLDDPCYANAIQYATGPYFSRYESILAENPEYPFSSVYELALLLWAYLGGEAFTGEQWTTEFGYVLDRFCPFLLGTTDHYLCLLLFGVDLKQIDDPSCGYGGEPWYIRELWTVPANASGSIQLEVCNQTENIELLSCSDINVDTISENENLTTCDIAVQAWVCGDGTIDEGEQCDDENTTSWDGCSTTCQDEEPEVLLCWNSIIDEWEECDLGIWNGQIPSIANPPYGVSWSLAYCTESCTNESISYQWGYCGDNKVNGPEQCDWSQNCSNACIITTPSPEPYCGDNIVNGGEQCDGTINCNSNCTLKSLWSRDHQPTITIDYCPDGDFSPSYYDDDCGIGPTIPQHGSADEQKERDNLIDRSIDFNKAVADITKSMQCNIKNELVQAYVFAFDLGVTTINNICNANLQGDITREEFSKFISTYAIAVLSKKPDTTRKCVFSDIWKTTAEMQTFARISCELNIMWLKQNGDPASTFRPKDLMTRAEIFTALNRLVNGTIDNSETGVRYVKHMNRLVQQKVVFDTTQPQRNTLRWEVLLMLMRAYTVIKNRQK